MWEKDRRMPLVDKLHQILDRETVKSTVSERIFMVVIRTEISVETLFSGKRGVLNGQA